MKKIKNNTRQNGKQVAGRHLKWAAGALLCVVLTGCGKADKAIPIELGTSIEKQDNRQEGEAVGAVPATEEVTTPEEVCVYVCGAVNSPGVVSLPGGSRYNDALEAAGGFTEDAAKEAVNLAKYISDGEQIFFPTKEEAQMIAESAQMKQSGLVNINTAAVSKLCELPGIGESKAQAIVAYREQNGAFLKTEDVMKVPGIKESAYNQMRDLITVQ